MLCMHNFLYFISNKRLCCDVVLCLCFILNVRAIVETPLVDAYSSFSPFHNLILIFSMIDGNVLVTINDI